MSIYRRDLPNDDDGELAHAASATLSALNRIISSVDPNGGADIQLEMTLAELPERFHDKIRRAFARGIEKCESPIERMILPWLISQYYCLFNWSPMVLYPGEQDQLPDRCVAVIPQLPIGRFRADFALAARRGGPIRFVIVECDGEQFHTDVKRDVRRDAELLRHDRILDVHAITGKQIVRSPKEAATTAAKAMVNAWSKKNANLDKKFGRR